MLANYHTHTVRCMHAFGDDREYIENAIKSGMKVLGFSDHCPWIYPDGYVSGIRMSPDDVDGYFSSLSALKKEYAEDITIYIGFESEYIPELIDKQDRFLADYPVDYMIMGQHSTAPENISEYMGRPVSDDAVLEKYVSLIIEGMESGRYKYVAHPDLCRFIGDNEIYIRHYTRLCQYLKSKDIPIEINMLGLCGNRHYPSQEFLKIAHSVGNKAIIGCDAHSPEMLSDTHGIEKCRKLAEICELETVDYITGLEP
ncbi:MAG: histidinol-phosphatase [Ruminococcus flavefaciens]|nr:histidinol-phosphatase [Ruminococcus flavefaciens]MCM1228973.1 histidinol-phosphatase [Ruminococcus flavefaciens]